MIINRERDETELKSEKDAKKSRPHSNRGIVASVCLNQNWIHFSHRSIFEKFDPIQSKWEKLIFCSKAITSKPLNTVVLYEIQRPQTATDEQALHWDPRTLARHDENSLAGPPDHRFCTQFCQKGYWSASETVGWCLLQFWRVFVESDKITLIDKIIVMGLSWPRLRNNSISTEI